MKETTATETDRDTGTESSLEASYRPTIGDVDHTNPYTDAFLGAAMAYKRGPTVVADGGRESDGSRVGRAARRSDDGKRDTAEGTDAGAENAEGIEATAEGEGTDERMGNVDHVPPNDETVNRVHERGGEGRPNDE